MPLPAPLPENVVFLHPHLAPLSERDRARLDLLELFHELDPASQQVLLGQLERTQERIRRLTPVAALVRGEHGPVRWRPGAGSRWVVGPASRRMLHRRAMG